MPQGPWKASYSSVSGRSRSIDSINPATNKFPEPMVVDGKTVEVEYAWRLAKRALAIYWEASFGFLDCRY